MKNRLLVALVVLLLAMLACDSVVDFSQQAGNESYSKVEIKNLAVNPPAGNGSGSIELAVTYEWYNAIDHLTGERMWSESIECDFVSPNFITKHIGTIPPSTVPEVGTVTQTAKLSFVIDQPAQPGTYVVGCTPLTGTRQVTTTFVVTEDATPTPTLTPNPTFTPTSLYTPTSTPLPAKWYIRVYNVDDLGTAYVNGSEITEVQFAQDSGWIDVTPYFSAPTNTVRFTMWNGEQGYSWGFAIKRDGVVVWSDVQGEVNVMGANNNDQGRTNMTVYDRAITVNQSGEVTIAP